jgi:Flp pilus assembly pilin Flp
MRGKPFRNDESDEIDRTGEAARLREKGRICVSHMFARIRVESTSSTPSSTSLTGALSAVESRKGGESIVTFTDMVAYLRARFGVEEGQTMAEYGVVLAVITALVVAAILALSGAIANALHTVQGYL